MAIEPGKATHLGSCRVKDDDRDCAALVSLARKVARQLCITS